MHKNYKKKENFVETDKHDNTIIIDWSIPFMLTTSDIFSVWNQKVNMIVLKIRILKNVLHKKLTILFHFVIKQILFII